MIRSGFVALCGRPNVGKSTLVNAIVGSKVAIVSDKPQTTRRAIRGVATTRDSQLVLVDLPGIQRPRDALTERMAHRVEHAVADADAAVLVLNGEQPVGGGDRFLARSLAQSRLPVVVALNKVDRLARGRTVIALEAAAQLDVGDDVFPISARTGLGVPALVDALVARLPEGPMMFPPDVHSDQSELVEVAELIREPILNRTRQELPHAIEVEVTEIERVAGESCTYAPPSGSRPSRRRAS